MDTQRFTPSKEQLAEFPWLNEDPEDWAKHNEPEHWQKHDTGDRVVSGGQLSRQDHGTNDLGLPRPKHLKRIGREDGKQTDTPRVLSQGTVNQRASFRDQDRAMAVPLPTPGKPHPGSRGVKRLDAKPTPVKRCKTPEEFRQGKRLGARNGVDPRTGLRR